MKKKRKKKLELKFIDPRKLKNIYHEYGIEYTVQKMYIAYGIAVALIVLFSGAFRFQLPYIIMTAAIILFFTPIVLVSIAKHQYEVIRFNDINSYMQQLGESMIRKGRIKTAMKETLEAFPSGRMHDAITEAVEHLENSINVRASEKEAFALIEKKYGNDLLFTLHEYCIFAEDQGGDFSFEFQKIDDMREAWMKRTEKYQKEISNVILISSIMYAILLTVCGIIKISMPDIISITKDPIVQMVEILAIFVFCLFVTSLLSKRSSSLLSVRESLSLNEVEKALDYIDNFDQRKNVKQSFFYGNVNTVMFIIIFFATQQWLFLIIGIVLSLLFYNMHNIAYYYTKGQIKKEMEYAFPKWLFVLCLLMQKNNIANAISQSIKYSEPIIRRELADLESKLKENPNSSEAMLDFIARYNIEGAQNTMRKLVNLNSGNLDDTKRQMTKLIKHVTETTDQKEQIKANNRVSLLKKYYFYPIIPVIILTMTYCVRIIDTIFEQLFNIL